MRPDPEQQEPIDKARQERHRIEPEGIGQREEQGRGHRNKNLAQS